jgi:hypothetical protein
MLEGTHSNLNLCVSARNNHGLESFLCHTLQIDGEIPTISCSDNGVWNPTSSIVNCTTGTVPSGIRETVWQPYTEETLWLAFTNQFVTTTHANWAAAVSMVYNVTHPPELIYARVDNLPPLATVVDIPGTLADPQISSVNCDRTGAHHPFFADVNCTIWIIPNQTGNVFVTSLVMYDQDGTGTSGSSGVHGTFRTVTNALGHVVDHRYLAMGDSGQFTVEDNFRVRYVARDNAGNDSQYSLFITYRFH